MGTGDCLLVYDGQNSIVEPAGFTVYMKRPSSDRKHSQCDIETVQPQEPDKTGHLMRR